MVRSASTIAHQQHQVRQLRKRGWRAFLFAALGMVLNQATHLICLLVHFAVVLRLGIGGMYQDVGEDHEGAVRDLGGSVGGSATSSAARFGEREEPAYLGEERRFRTAGDAAMGSARRFVVLRFSLATGILGLIMVPLLTIGVRAHWSLHAASMAFLVSAALAQLGIYAWARRKTGDLSRPGWVMIVLQLVVCLAASWLFRDDAVLAVAALLFPAVSVMIAAVVLGNKGAIVFTAVTLIAVSVMGVALAPYQGVLVVLPPLVLIGSVAFVTHTMARAAQRLDEAVGIHQDEELRLDRTANTDPLTGLLNRRGFHALAGPDLARARLEGISVGVVYLDLDDMKFVNDTHGHAEGDSALRETASALRGALRSADVIARLGGDEFAILARMASDADPELLVRRLEACSRMTLREPQLSFSYGIEWSDPADKRSLEEILVAADRRMYEAKELLRSQGDPVR